MLIELLGGLGLFLYGMSVMSEGLQRVAGDKLRAFLRRLTTNRFAGIFTGLAVTTIIQSSSATTVMLVGFVSAGLLSLSQAIGVIMGANIGTTVTGWLVALLGFKVKIATLALPAVGLGFFVRFLKREKLTSWGGVLLGFGILFLGLTFMKNSVGDLKHSQEVMEQLGRFQVEGMMSYLLVALVGALATVVIQSSSATMALTMTLAQQGLIDFPTAAALIMGENIGTTITANLAAIGASTAARQTARVHFIFNVAGVLWMMLIFVWFVDFIEWMVPGEVISGGLDSRRLAVPNHMAAFHTSFNILNTLIFVPLVGSLAMLARRWVSEGEEPKGGKLRFLRSDVISTPALAVEEARQTLHHMGRLAIEGFESFITLIFAPSGAMLEGGTRRIREIEEQLDAYEEELAEFTIKASRSRIPMALSEEVAAITGSAHDLERIGDHLEGLSRMLDRKQQKNLNFSDEGMKDLKELAQNVRALLSLVVDNIHQSSPQILARAWPLEKSIDRSRTRFKKRNIQRLKEGTCGVKSGILFIEILSSFERIGDHSFNIAQDFCSGGSLPSDDGSSDEQVEV